MQVNGQHTIWTLCILQFHLLCASLYFLATLIFLQVFLTFPVPSSPKPHLLLDELQLQMLHLWTGPDHQASSRIWRPTHPPITTSPIISGTLAFFFFLVSINQLVCLPLLWPHFDRYSELFSVFLTVGLVQHKQVYRKFKVNLHKIFPSPRWVL